MSRGRRHSTGVVLKTPPQCTKVIGQIANSQDDGQSALMGVPPQCPRVTEQRAKSEDDGQAAVRGAPSQCPTVTEQRTHSEDHSQPVRANLCTKIGGACNDPPALGSGKTEKILAARATLTSAAAAFGFASWLRRLLVLLALLGCVAEFLLAQAKANSVKEELFNETSIAEWDVLRRSAQQTYYAKREVQAQRSMPQPLAVQACFFVDLAGSRVTASVPRSLVVPFEDSPDGTCPSWRSLLRKRLLQLPLPAAHSEEVALEAWMLDGKRLQAATALEALKDRTLRRESSFLLGGAPKKKEYEQMSLKELQEFIKDNPAISRSNKKEKGKNANKNKAELLRYIAAYEEGVSTRPQAKARLQQSFFRGAASGGVSQSVPLQEPAATASSSKDPGEAAAASTGTRPKKLKTGRRALVSS